MKISVFYKIAEDHGFRSQIENQNSVREQLEQLKKELSTMQDEPRKKETLRKIARLERFDKIQSWTQDQEAIGKILKWKTSENYLWSDLLTLKKRGIDITPLVLISTEKIEAPITEKSLRIHDKFIINFGDNKHLNKNIGAGDILPPEVTSIKVNGQDGVRKNAPRPWYYAGNKYLPIFHGDSIEIINKDSVNQWDLKNAKDAENQRWTHLRGSDMIDYNGKNPLTDLPEDIGLFSALPKIQKEREENKLRIGVDKSAFIDSILPLCKKLGPENGIPWQVMFWQAALESRWGQSQLTLRSNNFFGIKSHGWGGETINMMTREEWSNWSYMENAAFRVYATPEDWLRGYIDFLKKNPRYKNAFNYPDDPLAFVSELKKARYATDSGYVAKVQSIWESVA